MKTVFQTTLIAILVVGVVAGCARRQKRVMERLDHPVPIDCSTAPGDLRALQHEKAHVAERIAEGVTTIYPAGLVVGLVTRTEKTKFKVAIGDYNDAIDERIAQIKEQCGDQPEV